jgi:hypothetical protein
MKKVKKIKATEKPDSKVQENYEIIKKHYPSMKLLAF